MKMKMFLIAAFALVGMSAMAQRQEKVVDRVDQRTVQELDHVDVTTKFKPYWYLDLQGGGGCYSLVSQSDSLQPHGL